MLRMCVAAVLLAILHVNSATAAETVPKPSDETTSLQRRLADAGCYSGALDGAAGPALDAAVKACPDMKPFLRIETGMHVAAIKRIGVDAACTRLATASVDKTVRIWSLPDGNLLKTVRLPIGEDEAGRAYATALSPDGRWLAAGGWDASFEKIKAHGLTMIDLQSGELRRYGPLENVVFRIAFSRAGDRIAVGLGQKGLRVYDVSSGQELLADRSYAASIYGLDFAPDGGLVVASNDGALRRYDSQLRRTAKRAAPGGGKPYSVAIDPNGKRAAVVYDDTSRVSLINAVTLEPLGDADMRDIKKPSVFAVAWARNGSSFIAGGEPAQTFNGASRVFFRHFDAAGRKIGDDIPAAEISLLDARTCGDGFVFGAFDPSIGLIESNGAARTLQGPPTVNMRGKLKEAFAVSDDASIIRFGLGEGAERSVTFDLSTATLLDAPQPGRELHPPHIEGLRVSNWRDEDEPKIAGRKIVLQSGETSRSLATRADAQGFVLGADFYVRAFDAIGANRWTRPAPGIAYGVNTSLDGEIVVAAYSDGTIRWLRWADGRELLAFFIEPQSRRWVAWTPSGYYMASPGGEDLIGWHLNRGWNQLADFFPASHFQGFNRPDIVQLILSTRDEAEAVRQANEKIRAKPAPAPATALPPVVTLASAGEDGRFSGATVEVSFSVRSPSGAAIDGVEALIDGRPLEGRGLMPAKEEADGIRRLTVAAPAHDFQLSLIAHAGAMASEPAIARMIYTGAAQEQSAALKPKLYVVAIGVSDYVEADLRLGFASDDARGFAQAIKTQAGGLYSEVDVLPPLLDRAVTRASVIKALGWLHKQTTARDIAMVLIAGHGAVDDASNYYFVPSDASADDLAASGVSKDDILREMQQIPGKAILFLDTCHANAAAAKGVVARGDVNINSVVNEFSRTENGLVVFSASTGTEISREDAQWGHGAFTKALIEGLGEGKADLLHHGRITLAELDAYIADRVKQLTAGEQHPVMTRPPTMPDFPFAMAR